MSEDLDDVVEEIPKEQKFEDGWLDPELPKGYLSPSQVSMYRMCSMQYMYAYILQLKKPPGIAQLRGTAVHKGVEATHLHTIAHGIPMSMDEGASTVSDKFDAKAAEIESWEEESQGDAKDKAIRMFKVYYREAVPHIHPIRVEHNFKWSRDLCGVPVLGVIDLVDSIVDPDLSLENDPENPNRVEVVSDLKTVKSFWPESRVHNSAQLTFYSIAENTNRVRIDFIAAQKSGTKYKAVSSTRSRQDKTIVLEDVASIAYQIKQGNFYRCSPEGWNCSPVYCGFYAICRKRK